jgi:hypothetical protein
MFVHPFTAIVMGGTSSGKTQWLVRLIENNEEMIHPPIKHILYCYGEINNTLLELKSRMENVELFHGVPTQEILQGKPHPLLLIFDDLYLDIADEFLNVLYTRGSHHWDISVILVTQTMFGRNLKTARNNSHHLILLKNLAGQLEVRTVGQQLFPGKLPYFLDSYRMAIDEKPFSYIVINLAPTTPPEHRLTSKIFPGEHMEIFLPI